MRYFISRTDTGKNVTSGGRTYKELAIGLYKLSWHAPESIEDAVMI